jgi:HPt (histidine-containing phosphotransfer) domain-containing protein
MNDPKPLASLGPSLLARKGAAKPAMRPQAPGFTAMKETAQSLEDLGWNDMGEDDAAADHSAEVLQLTPAPANPESEARTDKGSPKPKVLSMHEELALRLAESGQDADEVPAIPLRKKEALIDRQPAVAAAPAPKPRAEAPAARRAESFSRRAAFTLRLDAKRHLKLRLASTVRNRSAQQLVTEALDRFLDDIPEIEALAAQVRRD